MYPQFVVKPKSRLPRGLEHTAWMSSNLGVNRSTSTTHKVRNGNQQQETLKDNIKIYQKCLASDVWLHLNLLSICVPFADFKTKGSFFSTWTLIHFGFPEFEGIWFVPYHTSPGGLLSKCGESLDNKTRGDQSRQTSSGLMVSPRRTFYMKL